MEKDPLDPLFDVAPAEFVAARNALIKELKKAGNPAAAAAAAQLRRPSASSWAVNQLARRHPREVEALLEATARIRTAQEGGDQSGLRAAIAEQRELLARLDEAASSLLRAAGIGGDPARRIRDDLREAAAGPPELRERLRAGRLEGDLAPAGFEALLGASLSPPAPPIPPSKPAASSQPAKKQAAEREARAAEERAAKERERAEARKRAQLSAHAAQLEAKSAKLLAAAQHDEEAATRARAQATEAEKRARESRLAATEAEREAREARRAAT